MKTYSHLSLPQLRTFIQQDFLEGRDPSVKSTEGSRADSTAGITEYLSRGSLCATVWIAKLYLQMY